MKKDIELAPICIGFCRYCGEPIFDDEYFVEEDDEMSHTECSKAIDKIISDNPQIERWGKSYTKTMIARKIFSIILILSAIVIYLVLDNRGGDSLGVFSMIIAIFSFIGWLLSLIMSVIYKNKVNKITLEASGSKFQIH